MRAVFTFDEINAETDDRRAVIGRQQQADILVNVVVYFGTMLQKEATDLEKITMRISASNDNEF